MLALGLLISLERLVTLTLIGARVKSQAKNVANPGNNALGRVLKVYQENKDVDVETLELKLDEAILKETPALETRISIIKVLAAIAPMMGLLGTVTGMIATFQSIQLFGTGDPKLMAGGISMALVTTVQGLIAALPLMLCHAIVVARSKSIVQILEEQSAGIMLNTQRRGLTNDAIPDGHLGFRQGLHGLRSDVLWLVAAVLFLMWVLMLERFWYLNWVSPKNHKDIIAAWNAREETTSWYAHRIREAWVSQAKQDMNARMLIIKHW